MTTVTSEQIHVLEARPGWRLVDLKELWAYRDLLYFMVWREIKGKYAQSVLGVGWAAVRPLLTMIVFSTVFGGLAKISSDGAPYPIFSFAALVPWTYFSQAVGQGSNSLVSQAGMVSKIYFPRLIVPMAAVLAGLVDFSIALVLLAALMAWFKTVPTLWVLFLPALALMMVAFAAGIGMWLTSLAIQYRDIRHGAPMLVQLMMYLSPVVYPVSLVPEQFRLAYALNPMVGVIEGFRSALLGTTPMPWDLIGIGAAVTAVLAVTGAFQFRRSERIFADVA